MGTESVLKTSSSEVVDSLITVSNAILEDCARNGIMLTPQKLRQLTYLSLPDGVIREIKKSQLEEFESQLKQRRNRVLRKKLPSTSGKFYTLTDRGKNRVIRSVIKKYSRYSQNDLAPIVLEKGYSP